jgi:CYTH domain-containing protein
VRVRITGDIATVAIKGPLIGIVRAEFEYEFPIDHAERMLSTFCRDDTLEKQRFFVENAGATWHVDVYAVRMLVTGNVSPRFTKIVRLERNETDTCTKA